MRSRNLKPGFFINEELATLAPLARIFFQGLWCAADKAGYLEDRPRKLKAEILPYDDCDVEHFLAALDNLRFIKRYHANGKRYIKVLAFSEHQHPHHTEKSSSIEKNAPLTVKAPEVNRNNPSDSLIPDSLIPDSLIPVKPAVPGAPEFEVVWKQYPRRLGKKASFRHFRNSVKSAFDLANLVKALLKYKEHIRSKDPQYVQHGSTWFNNWQDWINFQEEKSDGANGCKSIFEQAAELNAAGISSVPREEVSPGEIFDRIRGLPAVPTHAKSDSG